MNIKHHIEKLFDNFKHIFTVICAFSFGVFAMSMGISARRPLMDVEQVNHENRILETKVQQAKLYNQRLAKELNEANTPEGMEHAARSQGYLRDGERQMIFAK